MKSVSYLLYPLSPTFYALWVLMDKLFRLTGFIPFILIIFLNAFVDPGHKILIQNTVFKIYDGQAQIILTAIVNGPILVPFILLFTSAAYLSDRHPKPLIMSVRVLGDLPGRTRRLPGLCQRDPG